MSTIWGAYHSTSVAGFFTNSFCPITQNKASCADFPGRAGTSAQFLSLDIFYKWNYIESETIPQVE